MKNNLRRFELSISETKARMDLPKAKRKSAPDPVDSIHKKMVKEGFIFNGKAAWPLPLKEPFTVTPMPEAGLVVYEQWDEKPVKAKGTK